ncbi:hypothetical protein [Mycolicibacterium frederiksbergense]|uniref:hypothetical protein n=1 Tax=Mycolicibacterium frederiksbergense TaxID=117567 RepID=UPI001F26497E|nr:hypothetical protein [Mycolicibacterium frederiksbergense]
MSASSTPTAARNTAISAVSARLTVIRVAPRLGGRVGPALRALADGVGEGVDELFAPRQVVAPLEIISKYGRNRGQPAQHPDSGGVGSSGIDPVVQDGGRVGGIIDAALASASTSS